MPYAKQDPTLERKLRGLERKFDKPTKHVRDYHEALNDIQALLNAKLIDTDHAELFVERAKEEYQQIESKKKIQQALKNAPYEREPVDYERVGRKAGIIVGILIVLLILIPALWF